MIDIGYSPSVPISLALTRPFPVARFTRPLLMLSTLIFCKGVDKSLLPRFSKSASKGLSWRFALSTSRGGGGEQDAEAGTPPRLTAAAKETAPAPALV